MTTKPVSIQINNKTYSLSAGVYSGIQLLKLTSTVCKGRLHLDQSNEIDIPVLETDLIAINGNEVFTIAESEIPDTPNLVNNKSFYINGVGFSDFESSKISGINIKCLLGENISNKALYLELENCPDYLVDDNQSLLLNQDLRFLLVTQSTSEEDIPDLEECACNGEKPNKHQKYKIKIDKTKYKVETPRLTGREILELAGYDDTRYLYQKFSGGERRPIELDEKVDFTEPGIERFHTMKCEHSEGLQSPLQQFALPDDDIEFLNSLGLEWECKIEANIKRLVIKNIPLPHGYNVNFVDVNMQINNSYPTTQIDMAYFYPAISRADNKPIGALTQDTFDGKVWQRWSRHRTPTDQWQPGVDCVATHFAYINSWFSQELLK
jgi:hypothetical protein